MSAAHWSLFATVFAQDDGEASAGAGIVQFAVLLLIPVAMYFLLIRPQRRRAKQQAEMQAALGVGDEVITTSGVYGFITGEEDNLFWLEIDDDVQIRIAKAAIQSRVSTTPDAAAKADKAEAADSDDADT